MDENDLFVNSRYVKDLGMRVQLYAVNNGVVKKMIASPFVRKNPDNIWYRLKDLPEDMQSNLLDVSITPKELRESFQSSASSNVYNKDNVKIHINDETRILPIVGKLLPSDGTNAYTVVVENEKLTLKPILVCWGCHWSELFSGATKYGNNVFCLASDLSDEQREKFIDDIIRLGDAGDFVSPEANKNKEM